MAQELIPTAASQIAGQETPTVNARDLHTFLEVGRDYTNWIKDRIGEYNFNENEDFVVFAEIGENPKGGRPKKGYHITLDMAKELAMVERTEKGAQARKYFIEVEKKFREGKALPAPKESTSLVPEEVRAGMKRCYSCKKIKTIKEFYRDMGTRDGLSSTCRECHRARTNAARERNRERNLAGIAMQPVKPEPCRANARDNRSDDKSRLLHCYDISAMHNNVRDRVKNIRDELLGNTTSVGSVTKSIQDELAEIIISLNRISQACCLLIPEYGEMKAQKRLKEIILAAQQEM